MDIVGIKDRRMVSKAYTHGDMETMETNTYPFTQPYKIGDTKTKSMGICEYKKRVLDYRQ